MTIKHPVIFIITFFVAIGLYTCDPGEPVVSVDPIDDPGFNDNTDSVGSTPTTPTTSDIQPLIIPDIVPQALKAGDTALFRVIVVDSQRLNRSLSGVEINIKSDKITFLDSSKSAIVTKDTTNSLGRQSFFLTSLVTGITSFELQAVTPGGRKSTYQYTLAVDSVGSIDTRQRLLSFRAVRSSLKADGTDRTELIVVVKDENSNPIAGEPVRYSATGGIVTKYAPTDSFGKAVGILVSERVNKNVTVVAELEARGLKANQVISFSGVTININSDFDILEQNKTNTIHFELMDANSVPIAGDSMQIKISGASGGFHGSGQDSMIVLTDTKGLYSTNITASQATSVVITANALGASATKTIQFTNDQLTLTSNKSSITGNGSGQATITASFVDESNNPIANKRIVWSTTFGDLANNFSTTNSSGQASTVLSGNSGSGLAVVHATAEDANGNGIASSSIKVSIISQNVDRLRVKVTPDNIPVRIGEASITAQAFDSLDNVIEGLLIGFRVIKGAGGGDEEISPPVARTEKGHAQAIFNAGNVISFYRSVKIAAVALDISPAGDTLVIQSSDTVGITVSGPPAKVSVGVNVIKGVNPNDGTFLLPSAAVVTDVNGNHVADGTPTNFSVIPVGFYVYTSSLRFLNSPPGYVIVDSVPHFLPWGDYNNNGRLEDGELPSSLDPTKPARGEDLDGNGYINVAPETHYDSKRNGVWDQGPAYEDTTIFTYFLGGELTRDTNFIDWSKNLRYDPWESWVDVNADGICQCAGQYDSQGNLYEYNWMNSDPYAPFPGEVSVGVDRQILTEGGVAKTNLKYVQTHAQRVKVRLTAEANGVQTYTEVLLPLVLGEE